MTATRYALWWSAYILRQNRPPGVPPFRVPAHGARPPVSYPVKQLLSPYLLARISTSPARYCCRTAGHRSAPWCWRTVCICSPVTVQEAMHCAYRWIVTGSSSCRSMPMDFRRRYRSLTSSRPRTLCACREPWNISNKYGRPRIAALAGCRFLMRCMSVYGR